MHAKEIALGIVGTIILILVLTDLTGMLKGCNLLDQAEGQFSCFVREFFQNIRQ
jgi:hypothetical protein